MCKPQDIENLIKSRGIKKSFVADKLGLSRQGFDKKLKGLTPFKLTEVNVLIDILKLSNKEVLEIFFGR